MQLEDFVFPFISLVGIPLLVVSAVRSLWKLPKLSLREGLVYYGWCLCLENLAARELVRVVEALLQREVPTYSRYYVVVAVFCAAALGILAAANEKAMRKDIGDEKNEDK